ncbi:beta-lactamase hydrolase domain-containing protein [Asaia lannensis]|uniref:Bifunctional protein tyrosine phosphatase family protein/NAD(P)/FAD-dependent oxidoreductase n=1 Tax=Asaia lannensis NBRC 102526 TaxID=1307926 RepID=A0ABT1CH42_9PROT|nr:bifunctional protein tyrosine phosphatase family protein/NAD(P)/FAD-dependent oxidoreductase [Asaia lannensis]MCO6160190.1 bifunctional protein tyrosine phosphatase family protein/NAD(P)/FAD-dependent oxidoreductase [Asaia lannensis NBRC 102526]GBQ99812.1 oxidoreductase [Asaia lannensis NBRC 102526]
MSLRFLTAHFAVSPQIRVDDLPALKEQGFTGIISTRPDGEEKDQPSVADLGVAAEKCGLAFSYIPVRMGATPDAHSVSVMRRTLSEMIGPEGTGKVLGYCRSGRRAADLFELASAEQDEAGPAIQRFDVVVVGGGAGGLACAASLLRRRPELLVAVVEPSTEHYYQPGWTLVGGGVFEARDTRRSEVGLIPPRANWIRQAATAFHPEKNTVELGDGSQIRYDALVVATGLKLDWTAIPGLAETLGKNGVTSNYRYDLAPYTWELVSKLEEGKALFTQPPMPIKCAGAPQKAMYLACDAWRRRGVLGRVQVEFDTATPSLFGVADFVPALMDYIKGYSIDLHLKSRLVAVDGERKVATFERTTDAGTEKVERPFDMLHVVPPQTAPDIIRNSPLAGADGFVSVHPDTMQHTKFPNVFAVGDVAGTSNAKTAAAARKQAPVVVENLIAQLSGRKPDAVYDGYGGCPLTVERGKIVLAEFGYGGKLLPTFPGWLLNGKKPTRLAWFLKEKVMPRLYWDFMLKGRELLVRPGRKSES